jgi:hypothetical protein
MIALPPDVEPSEAEAFKAAIRRERQAASEAAKAWVRICEQDQAELLSDANLWLNEVDGWWLAFRNSAIGKGESTCSRVLRCRLG